MRTRLWLWGKRLLMVVGAVALVGAITGSLVVTSLIRRGLSARDEPSAVEAAVARRFRRWATLDEVRRRPNPIPVTPTVLAEARAHFADHCALCHANDGGGQTEIGRNLYPRAPDMRARETQDLTDGELYSIIQNGVRLTGMPAWGQAGHEDASTWGLVAFVRRLPAATSEDIREMEKMNPRSPMEAHEEKSEADFLEGKDDDPKTKGKTDGAHQHR